MLTKNLTSIPNTLLIVVLKVP